MGWYRSGTVTVTSGSATVTGAGTAWVANVKQGYGFRGPDNVVYEVLSVTDDDTLTLAENYAGANASGAAYAIVPTQGLTQALAAAVAQLIADYGGVLTGAGAGRFPDGSAAAPSIANADDVDTGISFPAANTLDVSTSGLRRMRIDTASTVLGEAGVSNNRLEVVGPNEASPFANCIARFNNGGRISLRVGAIDYNYAWLQSIQDDGTGNLKNLVLQPSGGAVGIGGAPSQILDIMQAQNASTVAVIRNSSTGALASAQFAVNADATSGRIAAHSSGAGSGLANALTIEQTTANPIIIYINSVECMRIDASKNLQIKNTASAPGVPTGGGYLYVEGGALKFRGSSGTITTVAPA